MKSYTVYVAIDDEQFFDEEECRLYEYRITHVPEQITFFAEDNMTVLEGNGTIKSIEEAYNRARYVDIADFKGKVFESWKKAIAWMRWYWGIELFGVNGPGEYKYNDQSGKWENYE